MQQIRRIKKRTRKINQYAAEIELTQGYWARVDAEFLLLLMQSSWSVHKSGGKLYAKARINGRNTYMHRYIMDTVEGLENAKPVVDHINGDSLDNRRGNLRSTTHQQNAQNSRGVVGKRQSATRGVCKREHPTLPWRAYIYVQGRFKHLGYFATEKQARAARLKAEKKYFGLYAFQWHNRHTSARKAHRRQLQQLAQAA